MRANRPFNNFRTAITEADYFFGRRDLIDAICRAPHAVWVLLGGRRVGKTSLLHALEWSLLDQSRSHRTFPVRVNLQRTQPASV